MKDFFNKHTPIAAGLLALEDIADGQVRIEREYCFIARITDMELLKRAIRHEQHEQYQIELPAEPYQSLRMRVRSVTIEGAETKQLTFKALKKGERFPFELSIPSPDGLFVIVKCLSSRKGMIKSRYVFTAGEDDLKQVWEVDVFFNEDGTPHEWCKIDYEFAAGASALPPFPPEFSDVIDIKTKDPQQRQIVDTLFKTVFAS